MPKPLFLTATLLATTALAACAPTGSDVETARAAMEDATAVEPAAAAPTADATISDMIAGDATYSMMAEANQATGLDQTLQGEGPYTVFIVTNDAVRALPAEEFETLRQPENREQLERIMAYHVVPGRIDQAEMRRQIEAGGGRAQLNTLSGDVLTAVLDGPDTVVIEGMDGIKVPIRMYDVYMTNGVAHVIDTVMVPASN